MVAYRKRTNAARQILKIEMIANKCINDCKETKIC